MSSSPTSSSSSSCSAQPRRPRVSAEHTLNRVRENQRRHRARQRDRVAALEEKLALTEGLLADARAEVVFLKALLEATGMMCRSTAPIGIEAEIPPCEVHEAVPSVDISVEEEVELELDIIDTETTQHIGDVYLPSSTDLSFLSPTPASFTATTGPPPCCPPSPQSTSLSPECSTCSLKPPPSPSESTTLCATAYILISEQNFRNLDADTIRGWLESGLRRAQREGEGCRVENGRLWGLLEYISGI